MRQSLALAVSESSQVGEARRAALYMATGLQMDDATRSAVGIVVTEMANNLVRHAGGGTIVLRPLDDGGNPGVEALALDTGPGIANVAQSMEDGYSSGSTPGTGLGAIRRLSAVFDLYSTSGQGTAVLAQVRRVARDSVKANSHPLEIGAINVPYPGEHESGDSWSAYSEAQYHKLIVADGLGHGLLASQASREAIRVFNLNPSGHPSRILDTTHIALRGTRGAAVAVAEVDVATQEVRFAGIGNISASILTAAESRSLVSHNGTIGHQVRKVQEFVYPWSYGSMLVMHSDGMSTHWNLDAYPGLFSRHPSLIAGVLYRDCKRGRDDVTVLVAREARD